MTATTLAHGSLSVAAPTAPAPAVTFAQHGAAIAQLLVLDAERVLSVDRDRIALLWNPRTGATIARYELAATALVDSAFALQTGDLGYVSIDGDTLAVRALADHRELACITTRELRPITLARCVADLSRVVVSADEELYLLSLTDGAQLAHKWVSSPNWSPEILSIHATPDGRTFVVRFFHIGMDMYPSDGESHVDSSTLAEVFRMPSCVYRVAPPFPLGSLRVTISGHLARIVTAGGPLPDVVAHTRAISVSTWIPDDHALVTADTSGTIRRWNIEPPQHETAVVGVRFTPDGVESSDVNETKLWRDGVLAATRPTVDSPRAAPTNPVATGAWTAASTITAIEVRSDGAVVVGEANGKVTLVS